MLKKYLCGKTPRKRHENECKPKWPVKCFIRELIWFASVQSWINCGRIAGAMMEEIAVSPIEDQRPSVSERISALNASKSSTDSLSGENGDLSPPKKNYVREMASKFEHLGTHFYNETNWWQKTPSTFTYFDEIDAPKSSDVEKCNDVNNVGSGIDAVSDER